MARVLRSLPLVLLGTALCSGCPDFPESGKWACESSSDCQTGEVCASNGFCVQGSTSPECVTRFDCGLGRTCDNGVCVTARSCALDDDCAGNESCEEGTCAARSCTTASQCGGDFVCVNGSCRAAQGCVTDNDCLPVGTCSDGACCLPVGTPCGGAAGACCSGRCEDEYGMGTTLCVL